MKLKAIVLSLCAVTGVNLLHAENYNPEKKHEIRLSVSDGSTLAFSNVLSNGFADAILGSKRTDEKISGMFGAGYRYRIQRFKLGTDLGFALMSSKLALNGENAPSVQEREVHFLILPTAEFTYFKKRWIELYGSASAGMSLSRHSEKAITDENRQEATKKSTLSAAFAYQINPIALRAGTESIAGFVEAGFGNKGFITVGVCLGF